MRKSLFIISLLIVFKVSMFAVEVTLDIDITKNNWTTNIMIDGVNYEMKVTKSDIQPSMDTNQPKSAEEKLDKEMEKQDNEKSATNKISMESESMEIGMEFSLDSVQSTLSEMGMDDRYLIMVPMEERVHYAYYISKIANDQETENAALKINDDQSVKSNQFFVIPLSLDEMDGDKVYPYVIEEGDTLTHIAYYFWEKAFEWEKLLNYNEVPVYTPKQGEPYRLIITDETLIVPMYQNYILNEEQESEKQKGTSQVSVELEVESSAGIETTTEKTEVTVNTNR